MKIQLMIVAASLMAASLSSQAADNPTGTTSDNRVKYAVYNKDQVYNIYAKVGHAVLVQLDESERIEGDSAAVVMGDAEAWNLAVKGNNIMFKPVANSPQTNLIVTTNKRTYLFYLKLADKKHAPTYALRFSYPDVDIARRKAIDERAERARQAFAKVDGGSASIGNPSITVKNLNYYGRGHKELAPNSVWDDGRFTYFRFNNSKDLPAVFKILPDGQESLLNTHIEDDLVVVHETAKDFRLRLGKRVLGVENRSYDAEGQFNRSGTSTNDTVRVVKGE